MPDRHQRIQFHALLHALVDRATSLGSSDPPALGAADLSITLAGGIQSHDIRATLRDVLVLRRFQKAWRAARARRRQPPAAPEQRTPEQDDAS